MNSEPGANDSGMLQPGSFIADQLCVLEFLGSGGMSDVYKCRDEVLSRIVAVKTLKAGYSEDAIRRLQTEGRSVANLEHRNIVRLHGLRSGVNSLPILVMEFIDGISLASLLAKEGALSVSRSLRIALQIAEGLQAAHKQRVVHRDLKPSNIMIVNAGAIDEQVKILDFGIAKVQSEISVKATQTGAIIGTPQYMSPEQVMGKKCDGSTDQYSLGCVLFEMLCGHPPFQYDNMVEMVIAHTKEQAPPLGKVMKIPPPAAVQNVVLKLLQKHPDDRYESMEAVSHAIFSASTGNKAALGRAIGLVLGIVAIGAAILLFGMHGLEHKNIEQSKLLAKKDAALVPAPPTETASSPPGPLPSTQLNPEEMDVVNNPERFIHSGNNLDIQNNPHLSDAGLAKIVQGQTFNVIVLRKCTNITSAGVKNIATFPLINLDLAFTEVDDYASEYLARMKTLEMLCLKELSVTTKTCEKLTGLHSLEQLILAGSQITGDSLIPLASMVNLRIVDLENTKIAGSLKNLSQSNIEDLNLSGDDLTQEDFERGLVKMKHLRALRFDRSSITDEQLLCLARIRDLDHVSVNDCAMLTVNALIKFHKLRPQCFITQNLAVDNVNLMPEIANSQLTGPELISNGDFETGKGPESDQICTYESNSIPHWMVWLEHIRWVNKRLITPFSGANSIALDGALKQQFSTVPGAKYCLRMMVAPCPNIVENNSRKTEGYEVRVGSNRLRYTLPFMKNTATNMGWRQYVWTFRAKDSQSWLNIGNPLGNIPRGPFIDAVSVKKVIEK